MNIEYTVERLLHIASTLREFAASEERQLIAWEFERDVVRVASHACNAVKDCWQLFDSPLPYGDSWIGIVLPVLRYTIEGSRSHLDEEYQDSPDATIEEFHNRRESLLKFSCERCESWAGLLEKTSVFLAEKGL